MGSDIDIEGAEPDEDFDDTAGFVLYFCFDCIEGFQPGDNVVVDVPVAGVFVVAEVVYKRSVVVY